MQDGAGISTGYTMFFSFLSLLTIMVQGRVQTHLLFRLSAVLYRLMYASTICHENFWELGLWDGIMTERDGNWGNIHRAGQPPRSACGFGS